MERDFAGAVLTPADHARLASLCRGDPRFPADFEHWSALVSDGTRMALAEGRMVRRLPVDVDEFAAWCARVAMQPCVDALRAYLIIHRRAGDAMAG